MGGERGTEESERHQQQHGAHPQLTGHPVLVGEEGSGDEHSDQQYTADDEFDEFADAVGAGEGAPETPQQPSR